MTTSFPISTSEQDVLDYIEVAIATSRAEINGACENPVEAALKEAWLMIDAAMSTRPGGQRQASDVLELEDAIAAAALRRWHRDGGKVPGGSLEKSDD